MVSSMSLFTIVRSNKCPYVLRRASDSLASRCRLSSCNGDNNKRCKITEEK